MPTYCEIHQHAKWCEHNGGVMGATGWEAPAPGLDLDAPFRTATDADLRRLLFSSSWDGRETSVLIGPGDWFCFLGEPEDCTWSRDGRDAVDMLNKQAAEIRTLRARLAESTAAAVGLAAEADRLRVALAEAKRLGMEACELADEGWSYAGDYFTDKHECGGVAAIRATLEAL